MKGSVSSGADENASLTTFIREIGSYNGAKFAKVTLSFEHAGKEGEIWRRITHTGTTTRQLTWDGQKLKSDVEVTAAIREILGTDREAISALICLRQGELDKLFTGNESARRDIFASLVMSSHLLRARTSAINLRKKLSDGTEDLGALLDSAEEALAANCARRDTAEKELEARPAVNRTIDVMRALQKELETQAACEYELPKVESELSTLAGISVFNGQEEIAGIEKLLDEVANAQTQAARVRHEIAQGEEFAAARDNHASALKRLQSHISEQEANRLERQKQQYELVSGTLAANKEELSRFQAKHNELKTKLPELDTASQEAKKWLKAKEDELVEIRETYVGIRSERIEVDKRLGALTVVAEGDHSSCPLCQQRIDDPALLKSVLRDLTKTRDEAVEKEKKYEDLGKKVRQECDRAQRAWEDADRAQAEAQNEQGSLGHKIEHLQEAVQEAEAHAPLTEQESRMLAEYRAVSAEVSAAKQAFDSNIQKIQAFASLEKNRKQLQSLEQLSSRDTQEPKAKLQELRAEKERCDRDFGRREELQARCKQLHELIRTSGEAAERKMQELHPLLLPDVEFPTSVNARCLDDVIVRYQDLHDLHVSAASALEETKAGVTAAEERVEAVKRRQADQRVTHELVATMTRVVDAFAPSGVITNYLNYLFDHVAVRAQDYLRQMGANFMVTPCPTSPLSFNFIRTDNPYGAELYQNKLSGAQKVRLSIAVILAAHDLIIPNVGLLLLDEPSTHMDPGAKEDLADLLSILGNMGGRTGRQILVIDHSQLLENSFDSVVRLKMNEFAGQGEGG